MQVSIKRVEQQVQVSNHDCFPAPGISPDIGRAPLGIFAGIAKAFISVFSAL